MHTTALLRRSMNALSWTAIAALVFATLLQAMVLSDTAHAAQVTSRAITLATSQSATSGDYQIDFVVPDDGTADHGSFAIEFCDDDPLAHTSCVFTGSGDDIPDFDAATLGSGTYDGQNLILTAITAADNIIEFTITGGVRDPATTGTFTATLNGVVNPDNSTDGDDNNTFYARVYVYTSATTPGLTNGSGQTVATTGVVHDGGIAAATAQQLTLTAKVQERLTFCVGDTDPTASCTAPGAGALDLGVLDSDATAETDVAFAQLTTNANGGAFVEYFPEDEFKVTGATCGVTDITLTEDSTDQCLNRDATEDAMSTINVEEWGLAVIDDTNDDGTITGNLTTAALYDYDTAEEYVVEAPQTGTETPGSGYTLASSTTIVDNEQLDLRFAAKTAPTTPSGVYTVTLTFIATPTF